MTNNFKKTYSKNIDENQTKEVQLTENIKENIGQ